MAKKDMCWAFLMHLGYNMWADHAVDKWGVKGQEQWCEQIVASDELRFDEQLWHEETKKLAEAGCNAVVIDLGEGVQYESHPEIACRGAYTKARLRDELNALRDVGIEPIPKLNFSACHDVWMGEYSRMLSTTPYYRFCEDMIAEVCELFDNPRLFHLGMDEETAQHQKAYNYVVIRQGDLWWHDFNFLAQNVLKRGARPLIWSDYIWHHEDEFLNRMSKDVLQSNWFYGRFGANEETWGPAERAFAVLEKAGFDQIPGGSNWSCQENFPEMAEKLPGIISEERLFGFMQTIWHPMQRAYQDKQDEGIRLFGEAKRICECRL